MMPPEFHHYLFTLIKQPQICNPLQKNLPNCALMHAMHCKKKTTNSWILFGVAITFIPHLFWSVPGSHHISNRQQGWYKVFQKEL